LISQFQANPNSGNEAKQDESVYGIIKHPLQHSWTLWYLEPDRSKSWELNLNKVSTFNTVEDFWSLFNHIKQPSEVKMGSDYSLFKEGVRPMWEDPANKQGGRWVISLNRGQRLELDRYWIDTVRLLFFDWGKFKDYFYLTIFIIK
jgi:translation initiation factor 4E